MPPVTSLRPLAPRPLGVAGTKSPVVARAASGHLLDYVIRRAGVDDLDGLYALAKLSGAGFTSLPANRDVLAARLKDAADRDTDDHLLMLCHQPTRQIVGCAAIKARSGLSDAHWNFRLSGKGVSRGVITDDVTMTPTRAFAGASELGSLFLHPDHRHPGVGRFLSLSRLLLIGAFPARFTSLLWSELRGVVTADATCPFYDAVMGPLLDIPFREADRLYALEGDKGLLDNLPKAPIRVNTLSDDVRQIIAQTHEAGRGARRLLEGVGFRFSGVIDLFDGGPLVAAMKEELPMISKAQRAIDPLAERGMVADFTRDGRFECRVALHGETGSKADYGVAGNRLFSPF